MDKQIESAKSFFVLAQIFATIAGFIIVAFGIFWGGTFSSIDRSFNSLDNVNLDLCQNTLANTNNSVINLNNEFIDFSYKSLDVAKQSLVVSNSLMRYAVVLTVLSILLWFIGFIWIRLSK